VVILLSDHGEELWDHGGFEHGHTLYEELLRVPLIVRAPGVSAARIDAPVSLLDVAPTILELVGAPPVPAADGRSLVPLLRGDSGAAASFAARDLAFGRPLYGPEAWGVLHGAEKWTVREGDEDLFDLAADPGERRDLARAGPSRTEAFPERLGAALGTEVRAALRLNAGASRVAPAHDLVIALTVPGGVDAAWVGEDPAHRSSADVHVAGDTVIATWHRGFRGPREVWVVPAAPIDAIAPTLEGALRTPTGATPLVREDRVAPPGTEPAPLLSGALGSRSITVSVSPTPLPVWAPGAIAGFDAELAEMLQAMGYAVGPGAAPEPPTGSPPAPP
jgi:hypothetical protein